MRLSEPFYRQLPFSRYFNTLTFLTSSVCNTWFAATAGAQCQFSVIARDRYGNLQASNFNQPFFYLGQDFDRFFVPFVPSAESFPSPFVTNFRTSVSGQRLFSVLLSGSPGVLVEYFAHDMFWTAPIYSDIANGIFPLDHYSFFAGDQPHMIAKHRQVGVRWTGYLYIKVPQQLTFWLNASGFSTLSVSPSIIYAFFFDSNLCSELLMIESLYKRHQTKQQQSSMWFTSMKECTQYSCYSALTAFGPALICSI